MENLTKLTDDELIEKLRTCQKHLQFQTAMGHGPTVDSIQYVIDSIEMERSDRLLAKIEEETKKQNPTELDPINLGENETLPTDGKLDYDENW